MVKILVSAPPVSYYGVNTTLFGAIAITFKFIATGLPVQLN